MYLVGIHVDAQRAEAAGATSSRARHQGGAAADTESRREAMLAEAERRKADELGMDVSKFKHGIKGVPVEQPLASGLKWECVGTRDEDGVELPSTTRRRGDPHQGEGARIISTRPARSSSRSSRPTWPLAGCA